MPSRPWPAPGTAASTTNPPNPDIEGPIQVTLRVASRGNVLVHEIAPGGVPEPTMIYLADDRLTRSSLLRSRQPTANVGSQIAGP